MRKILAMLILGCAALAHGQVIGLNPTPQASYFWNVSTHAWAMCPNTSTAEPFQSTPQAFTLEGFNSSLGQWTPQTSCPVVALTTNGSSGPATLIGGVLNIPVYGGGGGGSCPEGTAGQLQYLVSAGVCAGLPGDYNVSFPGFLFIGTPSISVVYNQPPASILFGTYAANTQYDVVLGLPDDNLASINTVATLDQEIEFWAPLRNYSADILSNNGWVNTFMQLANASLYNLGIDDGQLINFLDFHVGDTQMRGTSWSGANNCFVGNSDECMEVNRDVIMEAANWKNSLANACIGCNLAVFSGSGGITFNPFELLSDVVDETAGVTDAIGTIGTVTINAGIGSSQPANTGILASTTVGTSIQGTVIQSVDVPPQNTSTNPITITTAQKTFNVAMASNPNGLLCRIVDRQEENIAYLSGGVYSGVQASLVSTGIYSITAQLAYSHLGGAIGTATLDSGGTGWSSGQIGEAFAVTQFTVNITASGGGVTVATIGLGGYGHTVGQIYQINQGSSAGGAYITVASIGTGGVVTGVTLSTPGGSGYTSASNIPLQGAPEDQGSVTVFTVSGGAVATFGLSGNPAAANYTVATGVPVYGPSGTSGFTVNITALTGPYMACGGAVGYTLEETAYSHGVDAQFFTYAADVIGSTAPHTIVFMKDGQQGNQIANATAGPVTFAPAAQIYGLLNPTTGQPDGGKLYFGPNALNTGSNDQFTDAHSTAAGYYWGFVDDNISNPDATRIDLEINRDLAGGGRNANNAIIESLNIDALGCLNGGAGSPFSCPSLIRALGGYSEYIHGTEWPLVGNLINNGQASTGALITVDGFATGQTTGQIFNLPGSAWQYTPDSFGTHPLLSIDGLVTTQKAFGFNLPVGVTAYLSQVNNFPFTYAALGSSLDGNANASMDIPLAVGGLAVATARGGEGAYSTGAICFVTASNPPFTVGACLSSPSDGTMSLDNVTVGNHGGNLILNNLTVDGTCTGCGGGGGGSVGTAGQVQMVGSTAGSFAASSATDNGSAYGISELFTVAIPGTTGGPIGNFFQPGMVSGHQVVLAVGIAQAAHDAAFFSWNTSSNPYGSLNTFGYGDPFALQGNQIWLNGGPTGVGAVYVGNSNANGGATLPSGCTGLSIGTANQACFDLAGNLSTGSVGAHVYTVSTLPAASSLPAGTQVVVSDATTFTPGICTGSGSDYMIAITNGSAWSCH
jgi:hypothetical protein